MDWMNTAEDSSSSSTAVYCPYRQQYTVRNMDSILCSAATANFLPVLNDIKWQNRIVLLQKHSEEMKINCNNNTASGRSTAITKTRLYNFDPLKPHFNIVKLGFTGVYIIFLISVQNIDCGYSLEPPRWGGSNEYPQFIFWAEIWKISGFFMWKFSIFMVVKFSIYLNRRVIIMKTNGWLWAPNNDQQYCKEDLFNGYGNIVNFL